MCGRFTQRYTWREIHDLYDLTGAARNLQAHYNIAPTDIVEVVRSAVGGAAELVPMRWGLIPYWWKKPLKQLPATFNARAESVVDKPMFRDAFKRHRCIIPASGYYEWKRRRRTRERFCTRVVTPDVTPSLNVYYKSAHQAVSQGKSGLAHRDHHQQHL